MSDGDNATPGRPAASDSDGANQWLSRSPLPPRAPAPWERKPAAEQENDDSSPQTNSHTDGVTVADLIAKVTGSARTDLPSRHAAPEPERRARASATPPVPRRRRHVSRRSRPRPVHDSRGNFGQSRRSPKTCPTRIPKSFPWCPTPTRSQISRRCDAHGSSASRQSALASRRPNPSTRRSASRGAESCSRAVPWPPSSRCSRSR